MHDDPVIYREEVLTIMGALADLRVDVSFTRGFFEEDDDDEEADEGGD
jgi:hypothetical protein